MPLSRLLPLLNDRYADGAAPVFSSDDGVVRARHGDCTLGSAFQPIVRASDSSVLGWEGLLRARDPVVGNLNPESFFGGFGVGDDMARIDRVCRSLHLANFVAQQGTGYLFINLHPRHLLSVQNRWGEAFAAVVRAAGLEPGRVVLEILEHETSDEILLSRAVESFKSHGFLIALDDFGGDLAGVVERRLFTLRPNVVKFDRKLLDAGLRGPGFALPKLVRVVRGLGAEVIAEGIETVEQRQTAVDAGIELLQGYLFGRPHPTLNREFALTA